MEVYKEIFLGQDPIDLKIEKISKLFDSDEFIPHIFFDEDFLNMYIPFSTLVLNSIESNDIRVFILTSLNKFTFKTIQNEEFVLALNRVLEEDNFHNVILTLKIFASLLKINIKSGNVVSKSMSPKKPLSPKGLSPKSPHSMKPSSVSKPSPTNNKSPHSTNKPLHSTITPSVSLLDKHISVIVDLINSVFLKLDNFEESTVDTTFFTLSQIFGYVSDVIQRQPQTEKKIEGIVHRTVSFFRLFLEHRRVIDLTKYNKSFSLEMISTLSKLFKIFSDSPLFNIRNDALNSTIFELSKFSLFYCPTDAIDLRKELFYYIFKILLKNKEMYLPKIEEFFDIRFFYLDESYLINIKGLIGLTDLALVFSGNLSRRVPHELQRRTSEILESNLMMVHEKLKKCTFEDLENEDQNEEVKLNYEKSLKFHLEIVYECVNLIYKQTTIAEKFALQKAEFIDFCYKQFLLVSQVIESLKRIIKGNIREGDSKVGDGKDNVNSNISLGFNNTTSSNNSNLTTNTTTTTSTSHFSILKSTFLSLSKPLKEIADSLTALLKNNVEVSFPMADLFSAFKGVLEILEFSDFDEKDGQFVNEILLFFFTPFGGSVHLDFITGLISQMFAAPFFMKIYLSILKRVPNLQMVVTEIVYQLISMLTQEKSKIHNFKKSIYSSKRLSYPEMVDLYEPVFDFIADIYNYNPSFISKKTMYALVNFLSRMISSQDIEDHRLLLFLLGTFNVKNDKSGSLHVYFYKKLHVFVRDFFSNYMLTLDPLYLDIIFSFPININAITSEWAFLLNPIRCALRLKDDISVKAISAFIHIIEASKGEIITGGNKWQIEDLFREIYDLLDDQRFTISCSQLLGRLKSYHKNYLTGSFYYYHQVNNHVDIDHNKYVVDSSCLLLENLVLKAIEFLKGKIVFDETKTIFDMNDILIFKKTLPEVNKNLEGEEASFVIICEYINEKVRKIKLSDNECGKESDKDLCSNVVGYDNPALYNDNPPVFLYDAIISLFQCSEDLNEKVEIFLKQIYEVAPLNTNPFLSGIPPYSLNGNIFLRALLESFGESRLNLTCELFYSLLSRIPSENLTGLLKEIISYFLTIRNGKMSRAAFRGLNSILQWEKLPNLIIKEDLRRILDGLAFHMGRMGIGFSNDSLAGISALVRKSDNLNCVCSVFKWAIDRITFGKPGDKSEMVFCEETLKMLFLKYENLFSNIFMEKIRGFFYTSNDLRDVDVFYTKVALFIFFVKNTRLFSEKETIVLVKTYFYYMFSCNFLIFSASQENFLTNLAIKSSDKFRGWERNLMKRGDLIRFLFYELPKDNSEFYDMFDHSLNLPLDVNEDERLYYYLSNEIIYMHLAFTKEKEIATVPFDIAFHNLPFGLIAPLKMLLMTNKSIITELLLEKYEECFNSTLSVQVVEKMITIFSVIKMKEDEKLYNFILKVFEECRTPVEGLLLAENPETSILAKTFELSLLYPDQTHLHRSVLRVAYPWLHEASRNYTTGISKAMLEYVENYSNLCFPLLVREVVDESMFKLVENIFENSIAFKNYVNNNQYIINSVHVDESLPLSLNPISFFLKFLRLVEFEVTPLQIKAAIRAYGECKLQNKPTKDIKDFLRFAINRFTENDLTLLFKTDPLLKLGGACNVKMFKGISSKSLLGCLLKSVSKADIKAFENLIRFYGDQSWMLVEMFVDCKFYSPRMIEYCKSNLGNGNIRSYLLYYLCIFEPLPEYFEALLGLSYEERKYTLYSLRKVVDNHISTFEPIILSYIKSEIQYKTNIHILYPLLAKTPSLITKDIARVLCGVVYRLLNTFIQFHQKIGTLLFDALYSFYGPSSSLGNLYNLLVLNYFYSKKSDMIQFILKYDLVLSPEFMNVYFYGENRVDGSLELAHVVSYMEHVIKSDGPQEVIQFLFEIIKKEWYKYPLNETTVSYLYTTIIPGDRILHKEMHKTTLLNILRVAKEKNSINWKQCLPTIKGLVQEAGQTYATIFQLFCDYSIYLSPTTPYFVDFVCGCMNKEKSKDNLLINQCNSLINQVLFDLLLDIKTPVPFKIALFALLNQKFTSIFQEEDFFNLTLSFFLKYRLAQPGSLSSLNELLYRGCTHPSPGIRTKFIQFLDEILPGDPQGRLVGLLEFDWSGCNKNQIPFIFTVLLLGCYDPSEIRMFDGSSALNYDSISSSLENFLFISPDSSLPLLHEIVSKFGRNSKNQLTSNLITPLIIETSPFVNDSLTYVLLKATGCTENVDYSKIKAGHLSFFEILNETKCNLSMYRETGIKDYVYGCLRATAKFPEVMQASVFQQFGKFKEAQKIYENLQSECVGSKVSFYEDEYENICREWVECTKELQQWDVLYNIGNNLKGNKKGNDHTLIPSLKPIFNSLAADSLFFLSNFNLSNERETFQNVVGLMSKGIKKAFYELFHSIYQAPSSENFVDLIVQIIKKMASGPRTKEFNFYYSNLIQIVLEMHDTTSLFTFGAEAEERINGLSYAWEDREPLIEGPYEVLSMFSTWRRHFFRRIEGYSNEGTLLNENEADEGDPRKANISTGVNKTKEYSEAISKLRKTMYIKGNNELGRNANFLALAAYKKGYYDNALFLLKEVFELPSIKILDAYRKVVYELMCFYDMNENKLGLDLANSTNIVHFSDEQSSNIFRMRGMFSERIKDVEETKKLYFQAIQFFSSPENHFYYTNLLLKHFDYADIQDEVVSSCLQGLSVSDSPYSKHLVMSLLLLLENHSVNYNLSLFKSLVKSVNVAYFVAFIPRMRIIQKNALYLRLIFDELMKKFPEAVVLNELNNKKIVKISDKKGDIIDNKVGGIDNKVNIKDNKVDNMDNNKETEDNENKDITRPVSSSHNNPQDFKFLKSILSGLREVFSLDEPAQNEVEMIEILTAFLNHIVDSITDINTVPYLDRLIELSESYHYNLDLKHKDSLTLTDVVRHLDAIRKNLKNKLKTPGLLVNNEKLDTVNKILTERRLPLFGSFSKIQKDYSNVVCVESFDSYRVLRKEKNKKEVFLIGSDGRYYKYEINLNKESTSLPLLYHVLALEINNCYHLRSRDAFLHLVSTQEIGPGLHVDVFDVNALSFEEITDRHPHDHLVEYVREYEKMCQTEPRDDNLGEDLENNIIRLLKPKRINKIKTKRVLLADFFKSLKKDWSLPKINSKLRLKVYSKVLPFVSDALPSFLRSTSGSSFSFFMQKCAFSKSFALNLSINNFLKIKTKDPRNDAIEMYTGLFLRRNLINYSVGDSLYISPGIQELIGIENLEGPFLSCLFLSSDFFLKNESFDLIMRYFDFDTVYAKEIFKKVVSVEGNDHEIIKIVSGWTDVNLISRNKVSENVWN